MFQSHKSEFIRIFCLLATGILVHIKEIYAGCEDKSFNSPCICLDDVLCTGGNLLKSSTGMVQVQDCLCTNDIEGALDSIAKECTKKNGRIRARHISGNNITSLKPLLRALKIVENQLIIRNIVILSLEPINSLYNVGSLKIGENGRLSDIGLGNVSENQ